MRYLLLFFILFFSFQKISWSIDIQNDFLIAKPGMLDPRFKETVIFMLYHNQEGAAGLVVNKPIKTISISQLFAASNLILPKKIETKEVILHWGGPVESDHVFFIHSPDYKSKDFISSNKDFTITRSAEVLFDIASNKGPENYLILSGIAVWSPGQLDYEMEQNSWDKKTNNFIPLFDNVDDMWSRIINSQAI